jgi:hypothetical protein
MAQEMNRQPGKSCCAKRASGHHLSGKPAG